ncbi:hypothetical protein [Acinetobacter seifertii]|uniref:hypothetical protein n=1 Tax=Acinetobacter seifertii TaxID=1530123 RepID=UPI003D6CC8B2
MSIELKNSVAKSATFQNSVQDFDAFNGQVLLSNTIKAYDFSNLNGLCCTKLFLRASSAI